MTRWYYYVDLSGSPPRWSGNTQRRARECECQSGRAESFPNRLWNGGTASCHSSGKVRRPGRVCFDWKEIFLFHIQKCVIPPETSLFQCLSDAILKVYSCFFVFFLKKAPHKQWAWQWCLVQKEKMVDCIRHFLKWGEVLNATGQM